MVWFGPILLTTTMYMCPQINHVRLLDILD